MRTCLRAPVNVWLRVMGVFVYLRDSAEAAATTIHVRLADRSVAQVMLHDPQALDPGMSTAELRRERSAADRGLDVESGHPGRG